VCHALTQARAAGGTSLGAVLTRVCERAHNKTVVVVVSDLIDAGADALDALAVLRRRGGEAIVLQLLHEDELEFPFDGVVKFEDLEGSREVQVDAPLVRDAYLDELRRFLDDVRGAASRADARYALVRCDRSVVEPLAAALDDAPRGARR
jgi:hypothetical protein